MVLATLSFDVGVTPNKILIQNLSIWRSNQGPLDLTAREEEEWPHAEILATHVRDRAFC
jgi:hypothetical protein